MLWLFQSHIGTVLFRLLCLFFDGDIPVVRHVTLSGVRFPFYRLYNFGEWIILSERIARVSMISLWFIRQYSECIVVQKFIKR
jgi:hypothetical protein